MDSFGKSNEPQPSTSSSALAAALLQRSRRSSEARNLDSPDSGSNNSLNLSQSQQSLSNGWANSSSSFGPVRTSSLRAHRSSMYSRPNCLGSLDRTYISNRYFGNTSATGGTGGRSLQLGTKKVSDNISGEPELTSTAQRIVKTLQTVETPVVNKEKVAMDSIKSLRPEMSTLKRKEPGTPGSGPPTLIGPLDISPQSSLPPLKAPRMNESFETNRHALDVSGGEDDNDFEFSEAWSFDGIVRGVRHMEKKSIDIDSLLQLYKRDGQPSAGQPLPISAGFPAITSNSPASRPEEVKVNGSEPKPITAAQDAKWECPSCMVFNLMKDDSCVCCGEKNPNKTETVQAQATWECPTCMAVWKMSDDSCGCCGERNPKRSKPEANGQEPEGSNEAAKKPLSDFKFGFGAAPAATANDTNKTELSNFKFGVGGNSSSTDETKKPALGEFKFGFGAATTSQSSADASKTSQQPADSSRSGSNDVGSKRAERQETKKEPSQALSTQTQGHTFGVSSIDEENAIGASSIKVQPLSGFRFGMTPAKPTVTSDKPAAAKQEPEKTWRCNICSHESTPVSQLKCRSCQAARQNLDESTSTAAKSDTVNAKKDYSFEPYYGLREESVQSVKEAPKPFVSQLATPFSPPTSTATVPATAASSSAPSPSVNLTTTTATTAGPVSTSSAPSVSSPVVPQFQFTSPTPAATSTPIPAAAPAFNFNTSGEKASPGEKRKAETFMFNPSEQPKLKTKPPMTEAASPPQSEMKTGSFLDALKRQNEDRPDGSASTSFGVGAPFMKPTPGAQVPTTSALAPATPAFLLGTSAGTSSLPVPTTKPFSFFGQQATTTAQSSIFGAAPAVTSMTSPSPSFGTTTTQAPSSIFGSQPTPALGFSSSSTPSTVSQSAFAASPPTVPPAFQFGQPPATSATGNGGLFVFGQQNAGQQSAGASGFKPQMISTPSMPATNMFGQPSTIPTPSFGATPTPSMFGATAPINNFGAAPAPAPMFNTPANNFGGVAQPPAFGMPQVQPGLGAPSAGAPALFNLGAQPTGEQRRVIKKAVRRMK